VALTGAFRGRDLTLRPFSAAFRGLVLGFGAFRVFAAFRDLDEAADWRAFDLGRVLARTRLTLTVRRPLLFVFCFLPFFALAAINATRKRPVG
jgi:hypothetical protein